MIKLTKLKTKKKHLLIKYSFALYIQKATTINKKRKLKIKKTKKIQNKN